jgi:hypothetical protein
MKECQIKIVSGPNVTQSIKSTGRSSDPDLTAAFARSFTQLKLTRSLCSAPKVDLSTIAAVNHQLKLRDVILFHLGEVRANLASQMLGNAWHSRPRSALPNRQSVKGVTAGRGRWSGQVRGRN